MSFRALVNERSDMDMLNRHKQTELELINLQAE